MNEKAIDQIEEEVLSYEVSDEAVEAAGTRTEIAGAWTFVCTGIGCNHSAALVPIRSPLGRCAGAIVVAGEMEPMARHGAQRTTRRLYTDV